MERQYLGKTLSIIEDLPKLINERPVLLKLISSNPP